MKTLREIEKEQEELERAFYKIMYGREGKKWNMLYTLIQKDYGM